MTHKNSWNKAWALGLMLVGATGALLAQSPAQAAPAGKEILLRVRFARVECGAETILESNLVSAEGGDGTLSVRPLRPSKSRICPRKTNNEQSQ